MIDVSIIISNYNKVDFIGQTIYSILVNNTRLNCEIIIVDDSSTDKSKELLMSIDNQLIIDTYKHIKNYLIVINETNQKLSETRNIGIRKSSGEYLICLDADDLLMDNYIQSNYDNIIQNNVDISYSNSKCFGDSNQIINWPEYDVELLKRTPFIHAASMYRKKVWETVGGYDKSFIYGYEDYDFWLGAAKLGFKFKKCNDTHLNYRILKNSMTNDITRKNDQINNLFLKHKHDGFFIGREF